MILIQKYLKYHWQLPGKYTYDFFILDFPIHYGGNKYYASLHPKWDLVLLIEGIIPNTLCQNIFINMSKKRFG